MLSGGGCSAVTAGLAAAMVVAVAFWPLVMSRVALRAVLIPPLAALSVYLFWRLYLGKGRFGFWLGAGFVAALCSYAYLSGWALLGAIVAFLLYAVFLDRQRLRSRSRALTVYLVGIGVTLLPLLATMLSQQEATARVSQLAPLLQDLRAGNPLPLLNNLMSVFGSFSIRGDQFGLYNIPNQPILPSGPGAVVLRGRAAGVVAFSDAGLCVPADLVGGGIIAGRARRRRAEPPAQRCQPARDLSGDRRGRCRSRWSYPNGDRGRPGS